MTERRLVAILAADMVGYSRLIEQDEEGTVARLKSDRSDFIDPTITAHSGHIVRLAGDGALVEFPSVVEATQCAVDIQRGMIERNAARAEHEKIVFRMGVNLGDIIVEDDNLHGEGINIAARLESLAEPGGILLSQEAARYVDGKISAGLQFLEERTVKNIERPVRIWRVLLNGAGEKPHRLPQIPKKPKPAKHKYLIGFGLASIALASVLLWYNPWILRDLQPFREDITQPLPDKPSIAVLPFANLSDDAKQEFFVDGLTEDLITDLAKLSGLFVISRNSVFTYKAKAVKVRQVAQELGVRYVLEGSVRRAGDTIRVNAQLIDGLNDRHLWAERFAQAYATLAMTYAIDYEGIYSLIDPLRPPARTRAQAFRLAEKATALDPHLALPEIVFAHLKLADRKYDEAVQHIDKAIALEPGNSRVFEIQALILTASGQHQRALQAIERAMRLDPKPPGRYYNTLGRIQFALHDYAKAVANLDRSTGDMNKGGPSWKYSFYLPASYAYLGQIEKAKSAIVWQYRDLSIASLRTDRFYKYGKDTDHYVEGLRKAGVPEYPFGFQREDHIEEQLPNQQIKRLLFGRSINTLNRAAGLAGKMHFTETARVTWQVRHDITDSGEATIEGDRLCLRLPILTRNEKACYLVLHNNDSDHPLGKNYDYVLIGSSFFYFSLAERSGKKEKLVKTE